MLFAVKESAELLSTSSPSLCVSVVGCSSDVVNDVHNDSEAAVDAAAGNALTACWTAAGCVATCE